MSLDSRNPMLEQFIQIGKSAKGLALHHLLLKALSTQTLYNLTPLLLLPSYRTLLASSSSSTLDSNLCNLVNVFSTGSITDFLASKETFKTMTDGSELLINKLDDSCVEKMRVLTLLSLLKTNASPKLKDLLAPLHITTDSPETGDYTALEKIIMRAVYDNLIVARINHIKGRLYVTAVLGRRDFPIITNAAIEGESGAYSGSISEMIAKLYTYKSTHLTPLINNIETDVKNCERERVEEHMHFKGLNANVSRHGGVERIGGLARGKGSTGKHSSSSSSSSSSTRTSSRSKNNAIQANEMSISENCDLSGGDSMVYSDDDEYNDASDDDGKNGGTKRPLWS